MSTKHSFVKCEAVKTAYRQSKDGMVVSFAIHPNEMPKELALAPVGTRVLLAVAEISDDETTSAAPSPDRSAKAKQVYDASDEGAKAVTRASLLCKDAAFQAWVADLVGSPNAGEVGVANWLRWKLHIESRKEIATDKSAFDAFLKLERAYRDFRQYGEVTA